MGQRHQVYVRVPKVYYNEGNPNNRPERMIGIHSQWLWGRKSVERLVNFLRFVENTDCEYWLRDEIDARDILGHCYSIDVQHGEHSEVYKFPMKDSCLRNPLGADNNNGVTIIDLTGKKPKYCFMSLHHLECLDDNTKDDDYENLQPMDAHTWIRLHYRNYKRDSDPYMKRCRDGVKFMSEYEVLKSSEVEKMFPKMFKDAA